MAAIPISQASRGFITLAPPWSKRLFKLGRLGYLPGHLPPQFSGTGNMAALAKAQAVVQANVVNSADVRAKQRAYRASHPSKRRRASRG